MPTLSFELRPRSSRRATALLPLPTRRLRSEVAAATSATSARAGVGPSGLGEDDMREDGVRSEDGGTWASLLAAAATEASLLLAAAATDASDSADGGGRPVGGRPSKKNRRGKRKRTGFQGRKGNRQGSVGKKHASVALSAAPAAVHTPARVQGRRRIEPLDDSEAGGKSGRGKKGRRATGQLSLHRDARVIVPPADPRPWVFQWEAHGKRAPPFTPPPAATPPNFLLRAATDHHSAGTASSHCLLPPRNNGRPTGMRGQ